MTKDQIKYLREQFKKDTGEGKSLASIQYVFDNSVVYRDTNEFIIFDDDKELVYCISSNANFPSKFERPYSVNVTCYEHLQFIEAGLTFAGLMDLLDGMFSSHINAAQKEVITSWAEELPAYIGKNEPNTGEYYQEFAPNIHRKTVTEDLYTIREKKDKEVIIPTKPDPGPDNPSLGEAEVIPGDDEW